MADRRSLVTGAALEVLADRGVRALTHREVDRTAGIPLGSTANLFSTREALLTAVVEEFERRDAALLAALSSAHVPTSIDDVVDTLAAYVEVSTRTDAAKLTRARLALFLARPEAMRAGHRRALEMLETLLRSGGVPDAAGAAHRLAAYLDGNALHTVTGVASSHAPSDAVRTAITHLLR